VLCYTTSLCLPDTPGRTKACGLFPEAKGCVTNPPNIGIKNTSPSPEPSNPDRLKVEVVVEGSRRPTALASHAGVPEPVVLRFDELWWLLTS
jgi:hypothetical protein